MADFSCPIALRGQHPAVLRVLASLQPSSPTMRVSDPVQSRRGCFKQLRQERSLKTVPVGLTKSQVLQLKALDNPDLVPAASHAHCTLSDRSSSSLCRRRAKTNKSS